MKGLEDAKQQCRDLRNCGQFQIKPAVIVLDEMSRVFSHGLLSASTPAMLVY